MAAPVRNYDLIEIFQLFARTQKFGNITTFSQNCPDHTSPKHNIRTFENRLVQFRRLFRCGRPGLQLLLLFVLGTAQAQKFGHINVGNILVLMPETKGADSLLQIYQDSLVAIGESRADSLKNDILAFSKDYNEGLLTPKQAQTKQAELEKRHQGIRRCRGARIL